MSRSQVGTDDEDVEEDAEQQAFFQELERRHGGPLSYEELQQWEMSLEDSEDDGGDAAPPATSSHGVASAVVPAPTSAATSCSCASGWMTPATPKPRNPESAIASLGSMGSCCSSGSDDDNVVTVEVVSRYASRCGSPKAVPPDCALAREPCVDASTIWDGPAASASACSFASFSQPTRVDASSSIDWTTSSLSRPSRCARRRGSKGRANPELQPALRRQACTHRPACGCRASGGLRAC